MTTYDYDIGVIGGGAAGLTVASGAAQLGAKVLLIEGEEALGGDCLHFGCVPSKTLIHCARVRHLMASAADFGLPAPKLPPVDFNHVRQRIEAVITRIQHHDSVERFCRMGVRVLFGRPRFTDAHSVRLDGHTHSARSWVVATGSSAAVPDLPGLDGVDYLTNREIFSLPSLPATLAILGGGAIAVEMAQAFCRLGSTVHLIQRGSRVLRREDTDLATAVMDTLAAEGVRLHCGATIEAISQQGSTRTITISTNGDQQTITADALLVALGRRANTGGLGLEDIGVETSPRGIAVDRRLRSSRPHIFAPGDVNGAYMFTHAAGYEGGIVVANAVFHLPRKTDYTLMPRCTYTDPELAVIGMTEDEAAAAGIDYAVWSEHFTDNDRATATGAAHGKLKLILDHKERPIGVSILGPHAGDLLGEWAAALAGEVKLSTLAGAVHPYPTLAEINKKVAGTFFASKIFSDRVKKGLKFFFSLKGGTGENPCTKL